MSLSIMQSFFFFKVIFGFLLRFSQNKIIFYLRKSSVCIPFLTFISTNTLLYCMGENVCVSEREGGGGMYT